jgi:hypothetical protein
MNSLWLAAVILIAIATPLLTPARHYAFGKGARHVD